ncbi:hypothetical protein EV426DRAFT_348945 [Tirmania nivea]|nr:hypothetical protein EV426DRAFT_348945 [Tirmania nivea]
MNLELGLGWNWNWIWRRKLDGTRLGWGRSAPPRFGGEYLVLVQIGGSLWIYTRGFCLFSFSVSSRLQFLSCFFTLYTAAGFGLVWGSLVLYSILGVIRGLEFSLFFPADFSTYALGQALLRLFFGLCLALFNVSLFSNTAEMEMRCAMTQGTWIVRHVDALLWVTRLRFLLRKARSSLPSGMLGIKILILIHWVG